MNMKFKPRVGHPPVGVGVVSANSPYARTMPVHKNANSHVPSALASVASLEDLGPNKSPLPGENLPEHHFKKRYFVENSNKSPANSPRS